MGPYDLSLNRGRGQYLATKADQADADIIANVAKANGKLLGMPAFSAEDIGRAKAYGAAVISVGDDVSALVDGMKGRLDQARQLLQ